MSSLESACVYVRLSSEDLLADQDNSVSIDNQLMLIREYASLHNFIIDKEYIDDGYSGIDFDRPGFKELICDIDAGRVKCIITKDMSRLGREAFDTMYYVREYFPRNNVRYIAINDYYDSFSEDNLSDDIVLGIRSIINDRYVKDTSIKRALVARMKTKNREFIGPYAPYGYKIVKINNKRTLAIDDYAAKIVRRIFNSIVNGMTRGEVASSLNCDNVLPPFLYRNINTVDNSHYEWTDKIIYRILRDRTYNGCLIVRKSLKKDYRKSKRETVSIYDREIIYNVHPAIIDDALFFEANSKIKKLKRYSKNNYNGLFSDLIICGECGHVMNACMVEKNNKNVKYYFSCRRKCFNRIIYDSTLKSLVGSTILDVISNYVDGNMIVDLFYNKLIKGEKIDLKIANLKEDIKLSDRNIKNLYIEKANGNITVDKFIVDRDYEIELKNKKESLLKHYILEESSNYKREKFVDYYMEFITNFILSKDNMRSLIDRIIIFKDRTVQISFKFSLS